MTDGTHEKLSSRIIGTTNVNKLRHAVVVMAAIAVKIPVLKSHEYLLLYKMQEKHELTNITDFSFQKEFHKSNINKEEFDKNARELLPLSCAHLHNEFLLAILTKCQLFSTLQSTSTTSSSSLSHHSEASRHIIEEKHSDTLSCSGGSLRDLGTNLTAIHSAPTVDRKPKQKQRRKNGRGSRPSHD
ncbi:unnamed protein product, partial [Meganyctiphanes norvegica]